MPRPSEGVSKLQDSAEGRSNLPGISEGVIHVSSVHDYEMVSAFKNGDRKHHSQVSGNLTGILCNRK